MGPAVGHYLNLNLDMDPFPHLGVQGGHHKVYGDIRPKYRARGALSSFKYRYGPVSPIGGPGSGALTPGGLILI